MPKSVSHDNMDVRFVLFFYLTSLTDIQRIGHENGVLRHTEYELMVPGVGHLLPLWYGNLHVHGRHRDGALADPAGEPGDQSEQPPRVEGEEAARHLSVTCLLRPLDELSVGCALEKPDVCTAKRN